MEVDAEEVARIIEALRGVSVLPRAGAITDTAVAGEELADVLATTDEQGNNVFKPADVEAKPGDVVRFTLGQGVHNVSFPADSNPGAQGLPSASEMLQLPGQTFDVKVAFAPGTYYFQCDPHALLGMKGHLKVVAR